MIIIDLAQAVALAHEHRIDISLEQRRIEEQMTRMAERIAKHFDVVPGPAGIEDPAFAGACLSFKKRRAWTADDKCPPELQALDPTGEL